MGGVTPHLTKPHSALNQLHAVVKQLPDTEWKHSQECRGKPQQIGCECTHTHTT